MPPVPPCRTFMRWIHISSAVTFFAIPVSRPRWPLTVYMSTANYNVIYKVMDQAREGVGVKLLLLS